jgi:tetratricopeptide (TPR) repeat protein
MSDADDLRQAFAAGGADAVVKLVREKPDALTRRRLFSLAVRTFGDRADAKRDFDALIAIVRAGVDDALADAAAQTDPNAAARGKDAADALSYDLAENLLEIRPGDTAPRARRHLEAGLAAAQECVRWRAELGRPPAARFSAWFARGAHQLSLGRNDDAAASFERAIEEATKTARAPAALVRGGDTDFIQASAGLGLAKKRKLFDEACEALKTTSARDTGVSAEIAAVALAQMRWFAQRLEEPRP